MNTPAHLAASLFTWRKEIGPSAAWALSLGAILPDAPMFGFYLFQKLIAGRSEKEIWSTLYFDEGWQTFFDVFNSIPIMFVLLAIGFYKKSRATQLLALSALLHLFLDFPLHHDDAHRHFLPLSHWRFASPISYWDPKHHGLIFSIFELFLALTASIYLSWKAPGKGIRLAAKINLGIYLGFLTLVLFVWLPTFR